MPGTTMNLKELDLNGILEKPLKYTQACFNNYSSNPNNLVSGFYDAFRDAIRERLEDDDIFKKVASMTCVDNDDLTSGKLYRFKCMIQDNLDEEYFLSVYTSEGQLKSGFLLENIESDVETDTHNLKECLKPRRVLHCISIPGENQWLKGKSDTVVDSFKFPSSWNVVDSTTKSNQKMYKNFPLKNMTDSAKAVIVKIYDEAWKLPLNEVVEFVGVLAKDDKPNDLENVMDEEPCEGGDSDMQYDPPSWIVPRLHAVAYRVIPPCTDLPQVIINETISLEEHKESIRDMIMKLLTNFALGDDLVAKYMLLHLMSRVYSRESGIALGKLSMNICGLHLLSNDNENNGFISRVHQLMQLLHSKSYLLDLNFDNINQESYLPRKRGTDVNLKSSVLQLSSQTYISVVERFSLANLSPLGERNKQALQSLAEEQTVRYDIEYFDGAFDLDAPMMVFSNYVSELNLDVVVPVFEKDKDAAATSLRYLMNTKSEDLEKQEPLNKMRCFINTFKRCDISIPPNVQAIIQQDFVDSRHQEGGDKYTPETFSLHLTLARLLCLSFGETTLKIAHWKEVQDLEKQRARRLEWMKAQEGYHVQTDNKENERV